MHVIFNHPHTLNLFILCMLCRHMFLVVTIHRTQSMCHNIFRFYFDQLNKKKRLVCRCHRFRCCWGKSNRKCHVEFHLIWLLFQPVSIIHESLWIIFLYATHIPVDDFANFVIPLFSSRNKSHWILFLSYLNEICASKQNARILFITFSRPYHY